MIIGGRGKTGVDASAPKAPVDQAEPGREAEVDVLPIITSGPLKPNHDRIGEEAPASDAQLRVAMPAAPHPSTLRGVSSWAAQLSDRDDGAGKP